MKKYKVTQEFMDALNDLRPGIEFVYTSVGKYVQTTILPNVVFGWLYNGNNSLEHNNRLIAIIQWINGEDVFEVERPHKFVVRMKEDEICWYIFTRKNRLINNTYKIDRAEKFNTREEAEKYCVPGYEVVEIYADGNEVE